MDTAHRLLICGHCDQAMRPPVNGKLRCRADADRADIIQLADKDRCPLHKFNAGSEPDRNAASHVASNAPDIPLPGDAIAAIAKMIGADRLAKLWEKWTGKPCGCQERQEKINNAARRLMTFLAGRRA